MSDKPLRRISSEEFIANSEQRGLECLKAEGRTRPVMFDISEGWERATAITMAAQRLQEAIDSDIGHSGGSRGDVLRNVLYRATQELRTRVLYLDDRGAILPVGRDDNRFPAGTKYVTLDFT
jgi:hypothetical protein